MAKPYSRDLRERMVRAVQAGRRRHEVARIFEVSASCVIKLMRRFETTGDCAPGKFGGHKRSALIGFEDKVRALVAEQPDSTLAELKARLAKKNVKVSQSAIFRFLRHLKLAFKKRASAPPSKIGKTSSRPVRPCANNSRASIRSDLSSSTKPPPPPR